MRIVGVFDVGFSSFISRIAIVILEIYFPFWGGYFGDILLKIIRELPYLHKA